MPGCVRCRGEDCVCDAGVCAFCPTLKSRCDSLNTLYGRRVGIPTVRACTRIATHARGSSCSSVIYLEFVACACMCYARASREQGGGRYVIRRLSPSSVVYTVELYQRTRSAQRDLCCCRKGPRLLDLVPVRGLHPKLPPCGAVQVQLVWPCGAERRAHSSLLLPTELLVLASCNRSTTHSTWCAVGGHCSSHAPPTHT